MKAAATAEPEARARPRKATSFWETVAHLYMIIAGPAALSMARSFYGVGYVCGSLVLCLLLVFYWYAMRMLVRTERTVRRLRDNGGAGHLMTYSEMMGAVIAGGPRSVRWFAPHSSRLLRWLYLVTWIGSLNVVLVAQNLQTFAWDAFAARLSVQQAALCAFAPLLAVTLVHRLKYLVPLSVVGNAIVVACIVAVVYDCVRDPASLRMPPAIGDLWQLPKCVAAVLFTINAAGLMMPLKNEMAEPDKFDSRFGVLTVSYLPMVALCIAFNTLCAMRYGPALRDSVVENLPADNVVSQLLVLSFAVALGFQYPLITYVVFDTVWNNMLLERRKRMNNQRFCEYFVRAVVFLVSFSIAFVVPNINVFMEVSGTIGSAVDSMIYPAVAESLVLPRTGCRGAKMAAYHFKNACIVLLAVIFVVVGLSCCVFDLIHLFGRKV